MKQKSICLCILLIFILLIPTQEFSSLTNFDEESLLPLKSVSQLSAHAPIVIDGNTDFSTQAVSEGWEGNGSQIDPYIIANYEFNITDGYIITIKNVDSYFRIENCFLLCSVFWNGSIEFFEYSSGIFLENVTYGTIFQNAINLNYPGAFGILVNNTQVIEISENTVGGSPLGIGVKNSHNLSISKNNLICTVSIENTSELVLKENYFSGSFEGGGVISILASSNIVISENSLIHETSYGGSIIIENCLEISIHHNIINVTETLYGGSVITLINSSFNTVINNSIFQGRIYGIGLSVSSNNNTITGNLIMNIERYWFDTNGNGIDISGSSGNLIDNNTIRNCHHSGIRIDNAFNNVIRNNRLVGNGLRITGDSPESYSQEVNNNTMNGKPILYWVNETDKDIPLGIGQVILINCQRVTIEDQTLGCIYITNCTNINVYNNTIESNSYVDLLVRGSSTINISHNVISDANYGLDLFDCTQITILNNVIDLNSRGVYIGNCTKINFSKNIFSRNERGIVLRGGSDSGSVPGSKFCTIDGNLFVENSRNAISIASNTTNILIINNTFINNGGETLWQVADSGANTTIMYNYWSDWVSSFYPDHFDNNNDGIVDTPYPIYAGEWGPSFENNQDPFPLVSPPVIIYTLHILISPQIFSPISQDIYEGSIVMNWSPAFDTKNHQITYALYYSPDLGKTWILIVDNLESTDYNWDISSIPSGSDYLIKVVTSCSEGYFAIDILAEPFYIIGGIDSSTTSSSNPIPALSLSFVILSTIILMVIKRKNRYNEK